MKCLLEVLAVVAVDGGMKLGRVGVFEIGTRDMVDGGSIADIIGEVIGEEALAVRSS